MGVYALVDDVRMEPSEGDPERIVVHGSFLLANDWDLKKATGPVQGYLYYRVSAKSEAACRREWEEIRKAAGTDRMIAFGALGAANGSVRKPTADPKDPDDYVLNMGLFSLPKPGEAARPTRYAVKDLMGRLYAYPRIDSPADAATVAPGKATLQVRNIVEKRGDGLRYRFEIAGKTVEVKPGDGKTSCTPEVELEAGKSYTWTVRAVDGDWSGPAAEATLAVKKE